MLTIRQILKVSKMMHQTADSRSMIESDITKFEDAVCPKQYRVYLENGYWVDCRQAGNDLYFLYLAQLRALNEFHSKGIQKITNK